MPTAANRSASCSRRGSACPRNWRARPPSSPGPATAATPRGCAGLGFQFEKGLAVARDEARAAALYTKRPATAARPGGAPSSAFCARMALGVPKDLARAAALLTRACDGGDAQGCVGLGVLFDNGIGVSQDEPRAARPLHQGLRRGRSPGLRRARRPLPARPRRPEGRGARGGPLHAGLRGGRGHRLLQPRRHARARQGRRRRGRRVRPWLHAGPSRLLRQGAGGALVLPVRSPAGDAARVPAPRPVRERRLGRAPRPGAFDGLRLLTRAVREPLSIPGPTSGTRYTSRPDSASRGFRGGDDGDAGDASALQRPVRWPASPSRPRRPRAMLGRGRTSMTSRKHEGPDRISG